MAPVSWGFLDLSALDWCKIFGSDGEPTHWKGVIDDKGSFRNELFSSLKITKKEWTDYWDHMHDYRNEFVAHTSKETNVSTYPNLNLALQSCHFYYDYLFNMLNEGKVEGIESLEVYSKRFREQIVEIADTAIKATSGFNENVY